MTRIDLNQLERRARQALGKLPWWTTDGLPAGYQRPSIYKQLLGELGAELPPDIVNSRAFRAASNAVAAWSAADSLGREAAELVRHPMIQEVAGSPANLQWLLENPAQARALLVQHSVDHPEAYRDRASPLSRALAGLAEYETFGETYGSGPGPAEAAEQTPAAFSSPGAAGEDRSRPPAKPAPAPNGAARTPASPTTYKGLIAKGSLSKAEHAELLRLAEGRYPEDGDEPPRRPQQPPPNPSGRESVNAEWARLIKRYEEVHPLTAEDDPNADLPDSYYGDDK